MKQLIKWSLINLCFLFLYDLSLKRSYYDFVFSYYDFDTTYLYDLSLLLFCVLVTFAPQ